jgi:hypothetical protein
MARLLAVLVSTALLLLSPEAFAAASVLKTLACDPATAATEARSSDAEAVMRLAKDWIETIRRADDDTYVRFIQERGPMLRDGPERWLELRDNLRGIQLCGVKSVDADGVLLWAFEPNFDSYALARATSGQAPNAMLFCLPS